MLNYIGRNYEKVMDICKVYSKTDYENVMGVITDIFIDKPMAFTDAEKFWYLITCIRNEVYNKKSKYNKMYNNFVEYQEYNFPDVIDEEYDEENDKIEDKIEEILKIVKKLFKEKSITKEERSSFLFYYLPENFISIKKMDNKQVNKLRKISYRKLEEKTNVDYQSIRFNVIKVNKLIKEEINRI